MGQEKSSEGEKLILVLKEIVFQKEAQEKLILELSIANKALVFQNEEKEKRAAELIIANNELAFQNSEKQKRAAELIIADIELKFQKKEKAKKEIANKELKAYSASTKLALQYARSLIEASLDPLVTINANGKITDVNEASILVTGVPRNKLIGRDFSNYFTEPEKARAGYLQVFEKGFVSDYPLTIKHKNGKLTDVLYNASVYRDDKDNVLGVFAAARDVTDQNKITVELNEAKILAELATEIAEEAKGKAEAAKLLAENAVQSKQQFLSNMSHEIRTPMNSIIGFTKVLLKTNLTSKQKEYLSAIKTSGEALTILINDILDLAKVDAGKMTFEKTPFKMKVSVSAILHLFENTIREKNLGFEKTFDPRIPEILIGDPARLHQIILNLLSNAVKFTTKGKISASVTLLNEDDEKATVEFAIKDTGIGIPEDKIISIFEAFQQASSETSRLYGGTGLGLAIVKRIVEGQGGTITVKSKVNEGSTFSFILNYQKTIAKTEAFAYHEEKEILEKPTKNIHILVVEDIPLNQLLMKTLLDDFGFELEIAGNGKIAIEKLLAKSYDIILMDLQMPEMNGFEATDYIRKIMKLSTPIVALTADVTSVDLARCKAVGMNDYISKPVDEKLLYRKIVDLVSKTNHLKTKNNTKKQHIQIEILKCTNLDYLKQRTKSNPELMREMIELYLEQTPAIIASMKQGWKDKNWEVLHAGAHKMVPSFSIVGIDKAYELKAKKIQEYPTTLIEECEIEKMLLELETICSQACEELKEDLQQLINKPIAS